MTTDTNRAKTKAETQGGFDHTKPAWTRDGQQVDNLVRPLTEEQLDRALYVFNDVHLDGPRVSVREALRQAIEAAFAAPVELTSQEPPHPSWCPCVQCSPPKPSDPPGPSGPPTTPRGGRQG